MDIDDVHRSLGRGRFGHHCVELRATELAAGDVQFLEYLHQFDAIAFRPVFDCGNLGCDTGIVAVLVIVADADIPIGAQRLAHLFSS
nr:hypothetical protein [uncultured Sphingomonas sp.]